VIFAFPRDFPPDEVELRLPDIEAAKALLGDRSIALADILARRREALAPLLATPEAQALLERSERAVRLGYAHFRLRYGRFGGDFHAYHNEGHVLEILDGRISRLLAANGVDALSLRSWCVLMLFAACHDLRQRETSEFAAGVGANERASIEEAMRILDASGFSPERDARIYIALDLAICGSTFDARKPDDKKVAYNPAEWVQSGGALATKLDQKLDKHRPGWRDDPDLVQGYRIALIAADLDTANVAEPFERFTLSAENLSTEREMLARRSLDSAESAQPIFDFLTAGQERFFFELHRFSSALGLAAFGAAKAANAPKLKALTARMRQHVTAHGLPASGRAVLDVFRAIVKDES
jgi:hypothetical protein